MSSEILVSIFFLTYNEEKYVAQALESILAQKVSFAYEIICHDDASTDGTIDILKNYQKNYPDVVRLVLQKENQMSQGINITLKFMYPIAKGKYIAYCDGDDYWSDTKKLEKEVEFLENHPDYVMTLHNYSFLYETSGKKTLAKCGKKDMDLQTNRIIDWNDGIPQIGTAVFRKNIAEYRPDLFIKIGGGENSKRPISDLPLYIYLSLNGKIRYFASSMSIWRRRISGTWNDEKNKGKQLNFLQDLISFYEKLDLYTSGNFTISIRKKINKIHFSYYYLKSEYKTALKYAIKSKQKLHVLLKTVFLLLFPKMKGKMR